MYATGRFVPVSMLLPLTACLATCALLQGCGSPPTPGPAVTVEIITSAGENVIAADALADAVGTIEVFEFTEGPVWVPAPHNLWIFVDIPGNKMYQYDGSTVTVYRNPSNKGNGNLWHDGKLLTCEQSGRAVVRTDVPFDSDSRVEIVTEFNSSKLNSPNDIVIGKDGAIYFTDPGYGSSPEWGHGLPLEQDFRNLFRLDETNGELVSVWRSEDRQPNGLVFNEDFTKLYLGDSGDLARITVFDVAADGVTLSNEQEFAKCTAGIPDGMKMDALGNVWVACGEGAVVFAADGTRIANINTPEPVGNLGFGGADGRDLMITASTSVWIIKTKVAEMSRNIQGSTALV